MHSHHRTCHWEQSTISSPTHWNIASISVPFHQALVKWLNLMAYFLGESYKPFLSFSFIHLFNQYLMSMYHWDTVMEPSFATMELYRCKTTLVWAGGNQSPRGVWTGGRQKAGWKEGPFGGFRAFRSSWFTPHGDRQHYIKLRKNPVHLLSSRRRKGRRWFQQCF